MRRFLISLLAAVSLAFPLASQAARTDDTLAYTTATIRLRERPSTNAKVLAILAQGTAVRRYHCVEGWCGVSIQKISGYALEEYLTTQPLVQPVASTPQGQGRGYINSQGNWVPSPTTTADGQPPAGATAKCRDGTFSFSQSRRGTCSHHGGVAQWL